MVLGVGTAAAGQPVPCNMLALLLYRAPYRRYYSVAQWC